MRRLMVATLVVAAVFAGLTSAVLATLRAEAGGPLAVSGADLLDMGTLGRLRVALTSTGGKVGSFVPGGVVAIQTAHGQPRRTQTILFAPQAVFVERGQVVGRSAVEIGAHLSALGFRGSHSFAAYKVRISPHHRAIGGLILQDLGNGYISLLNHEHAYALVKVLPGAAMTLRGRPTRKRLHTNMHVLTLAVRDPQQPGLYLADAVHILQPRISLRTGGIIQRIDAAHNVVAMYNKTQGRVYTVEIVPGSTKITLSKWDAGYGDMNLGDHLTVSGYLDQTHNSIGPNPLVARRIRLGSPTFGGVIAAIAPAARGGVVLTVRAHHGHVLRIDGPGRIPVNYGTQPAHVLDLTVGEKISAHGTRIGKFELTATSIKVYPHQHTVGGNVAGILPGIYRIVNATSGAEFIIHVTARTSYSLNGHTVSAAAAHIVRGVHLRVHGYDALHDDQKSIATLIASHISVIVHHAHHTTHRSVHHAPPTPSASAHPTPTHTAGAT